MKPICLGKKDFKVNGVGVLREFSNIAVIQHQASQGCGIQADNSRQNSQSCLKLFHVLVAPQVAAVQMAQVCTAGSVCFIWRQGSDPIAHRPCRSDAAERGSKIQTNWRAAHQPACHPCLPLPPAVSAFLPHSTPTHTWEKMLSNNSDTGFALHTAISKALGCWECFPVLPSLAQGWHWTDHSPTHC